MARLNVIIDSDDDLPELSTLLARSTIANERQHPPPSQSKSARQYLPSSSCEKPGSGIAPARTGSAKKQRSLKLAHAGSLRIPLTGLDGLPLGKGPLSTTSYIRSSPRKAVRSPPQREPIRASFTGSSDFEDDFSDHMSDFIVSDWESDGVYGDYTQQSHNPLPKRQSQTPVDLFPKRHFPPRNIKAKNLDETASLPKDEAVKASAAGYLGGESLLHVMPTAGTVWKDHESSLERSRSVLKFSPPRFKSPSRSPPIDRAITPPIKHTKSKLLSPTKRVHIPLSPHRPSIDAFWSQEIINDWNDLHSSKKELDAVPNRIIHPLDEDDDDYLSPLETRHCSSSTSPAKKDKKAIEKRRAFSKGKYDLAASFLNELDEIITNGQIARLAESTGGVRLVWNKKLQSTAGQAKWKQEVIQSKSPDGTVNTKKYRHHASIELAEKVIDDEDRLFNVIAHEYCHLLTFMISNVKDRPHGKEFKVWAKKCSTAFAHRGVKVVTTHSYEISYKFVWVCNHCGTEYKRHSKSIDPARHSCGKCKEKLVQVKPVPRGEGKGREMSEYQRFVKERFASVKRERPELKMGEIMVVLGRDFRELKEKGKKDEKDHIIVQERSVEDGDLDDPKDARFDSVARKLDFLTLASA
ncbi:MAG: hypothetical protein LQ348_000006 [Seirophora lacunosa]|nr:MAG: hypothetical protein LQ348_000006 [Seirophora lacunosa]